MFQPILTCFPASEDLGLPHDGQVLKPSDSLKSTSIVSESSENTGRTYPSTKTSKNLMQLNFADAGCLPEDTLASLFHKPGSVEARKTTVTSGQRCSELFESADPLGCLQKMLLVTSAWVSTKCWLTWIVKGTPRGRLLFQLVPKTHHTDGIESGLWRTPTATEYFPPLKNISEIDPKKMEKRGKHSLATQVNHPQMWPTPRAQDAKHGAATEWELNTDHAGTRDSLRVQVEHRKHWPTPTAQDAKNNGGPSQMHRNSLPLNAEAGGSLNPAWVEWLMGYPTGWTDLEE